MSTDSQHGNDGWQRVTFRAPPEMIEQLDQVVDDERAPNRSEVIRHCIRQMDAGAHYPEVEL